MKRITAFFFAVALLLASAYADNVFEQPVPFGIITQKATVYSSTSGKNSVGSVSADQIVAIDSSTDYSGSMWYHIIFFSGKKEVSGYLQEKHIKQLTVSGLISVLADPDALATIQQFKEVKTSAEYVSSFDLSVLTASVSGAKSEKTQTYILNKNSKKFHHPSCNSVKVMSEKNKMSFTGTREEVIKMGYSPCGNCNP